MLAVIIMILLLAIYIVIEIVAIVTNYKLRKELNRYNSLVVEKNDILMKLVFRKKE